MNNDHTAPLLNERQSAAPAQSVRTSDSHPAAQGPKTSSHPAIPEIESCYHIGGSSLQGCACSGTACFVAKHLDPQRWATAVGQHPRVYCLGKCFAAPALLDNTPARPRVEVHARQGILLGRLAKGGARKLEDYLRLGGYKAFQSASSRSPNEVVQTIEDSGLRGRGGAGFPTGRKWRSVLAQQRTPKYVIANADEGDAGAYIDRFLMEEDPHSLLEGMAIAAHAVGANQGIIYLRAEYPEARKVLGDAIHEASGNGLLGDFTVEVFNGRGSYICGEETALIQSLEGKRPEVQARPPYPTEHGLFGRPTLLNNVETFVSVPWIISSGAEAYYELGFSKSRGTKAVSLNSLFARPGLYEVDFGTSLRHIVENIGGGLTAGTLKGVLVGGPLAGIIPPHLLDTPFAFEELRSIGGSVGHGGIVVFDEHTSIPELVHHVFSFGAYESCGKCTPCRLGSRRIETLFQQIVSGRAAGRANEAEFRRIVDALKLTSLCGHGIGLAEFAESVLRHYGKELEECFR